MSRSVKLPPPESFLTFGALLRYLRRRVALTQAELAAAVGYSEAQISRLEHNRRKPEPTILRARFLTALQLDDLPEHLTRLLALADAAHREAASPDGGEAPAPGAALVGRASEQAALQRMLAGNARLITLTGPPGVGKTRLARHVAQRVGPHFPGGVHWVDLTAVVDHALVLTTIMLALQIHEGTASARRQRLAKLLGQRRTLLVLDNFEQLLAAAPQLNGLLADAAMLTMLVTSRAPLHLAGEQRVALAPLALPSAATLTPEQLATVPAVALLVQRLRAVNPAFRLDAANAPAIAAICIALDGLPLALELVAAHGRLLTPRELLEQVARRQHRLARRPGAQGSHQDSLTGTLAWSLVRLPVAVQTLFARLAIFVGGWTFEAVTAVCNSGLEDIELFAASETLLDHSLVQQHRHSERTRFTMLVTVRTFAQAQLVASGEHAELRRRHAAHMLTVALEAERELRGPQQREWFERIAAELENISAALSWAAQHDLALGLRLAGALERFWYTRGYGSEGQRWLERLLAQPACDQVPPSILAGAQTVAAILAYRASDYARAATLLHLCLAQYQALGDQANVACALNNLGNIALDSGAIAQAQAHYHASLTLRRSLGDLNGIASTLNNLAEALRLQGDLDQAQAAFDESLALYRQIGETWSIASVLSNLAMVASQQRRHADAQALYEESLAIRADLGDRPGRARVLTGLGDVLRVLGAPERAAACYRESLALLAELPERAPCVQALVGLAQLNVICDPERAVRLLGAADALIERHSLTGDPMLLADYTQATTRLAAVLDERRRDLLWRAGRALSTASAIAYALGKSGPGIN